MYSSFFMLTAACLWQILVESTQYELGDLPTILEGPRNQFVRRGGMAFFMCKADALVYEWNKNGRKLSMSSRNHAIFYSPERSVVLIEDAQLGRDNAHYECVANNFGEPDVTAEATLHIYDNDEVPPGFPTITDSPVTVEVKKGGNALLKCAATGNPVPSFWWVKGRTPMTGDDSKYTILNTTQPGDTLQISSFRVADAGEYRCVAENNFGTEFSDPITVKICRDPLRFQNAPPPTVEVREGADVNVTCEAVADKMDPQPTVKWVKYPDTQITPEPLPIGKAVLELRRIQKSANYTCTAESNSSTISIMTQVTVQRCGNTE